MSESRVSLVLGQFGPRAAALCAAGFDMGPTTPRRRWMDFPSWIARMHTPAVFADAIRAYQATLPPDVIRHFEVAGDGGFLLDTLTMACRGG